MDGGEDPAPNVNVMPIQIKDEVVNEDPEIVLSNKGGLKLIHKGFMYTLHKKQPTTIRWRCVLRTQLCRGSLITNLEFKDPFVRMYHTHPPDFEAAELSRRKYKAFGEPLNEYLTSGGIVMHPIPRPIPRKNAPSRLDGASTIPSNSNDAAVRVIDIPRRIPRKIAPLPAATTASPASFSNPNPRNTTTLRSVTTRKNIPATVTSTASSASINETTARDSHTFRPISIRKDLSTPVSKSTISANCNEPLIEDTVTLSPISKRDEPATVTATTTTVSIDDPVAEDADISVTVTREETKQIPTEPAGAAVHSA